MMVAYLESIKYVGHLFPMAVLRVYVGWSFFKTAWLRYQGDYLSEPAIVASISEWGTISSAPEWYKTFLDQIVVQNWLVFAYCVVYFGFLVGVSLIIGFFVRPISILAAVMTINFIFISSPEMLIYYELHLVLMLVFAWLGAGRCLGLDYFFYKRDRGIWW